MQNWQTMCNASLCQRAEGSSGWIFLQSHSSHRAICPSSFVSELEVQWEREMAHRSSSKGLDPERYSGLRRRWLFAVCGDNNRGPLLRALLLPLTQKSQSHHRRSWFPPSHWLFARMNGGLRKKQPGAVRESSNPILVKSHGSNWRRAGNDIEGAAGDFEEVSVVGRDAVCHMTSDVRISFDRHMTRHGWSDGQMFSGHPGGPPPSHRRPQFFVSTQPLWE